MQQQPNRLDIVTLRTFQTWMQKRGNSGSRQRRKQEKLTKNVWGGFHEFIASCRMLQNHAKKMWSILNTGKKI